MSRFNQARRRLGTRSCARLGLSGLGFAVAISAGCEDGVAGPTTRRGTEIPPATGCTNPNHTGPQTWTGGLEPRQIAAAYGIDELWDAGFRGQGRRVALIEPGQRLDMEMFQSYSDCWGPFALPQEIVVRGGTPVFVGDEPNFDSQVMLSMAPELEAIYMFESEHGAFENLAPLLRAALDPTNTGGERVHAISISYGVCEAGLLFGQIEAANAELRRAAELGVKVFIAIGDAGSLGSYPNSEGGVNCVDWPVPPNPPPDVALGVLFPPSSPWALAVGGTELAINGAIPFAGSPEGGVVTNEVVWDQEIPGEGVGTWAGGGGPSLVFPISDAPWQRDLLGLDGMRHTPDVTALAGSPFYPGGGFGTSGAAPMTAGAMMVVDSYLIGHGVEPPGFLSPILYQLALTDYERVFRDVVDGNNDVYHLGCCYATPGYDMASGLGSIRFDELAKVLLERAGGG